MEFSEPKGIYLQIADRVRDRILAGEWNPDERIPSVREMAVELGVNPNTVARSYQALVDRQLIVNQRGRGYFVTENAVARVLAEMREEFRRDELPRIVRTMRLLGIGPDEIATRFAANDDPDGKEPLMLRSLRTSEIALLGTLGLLAVLIVALPVSLWVPASQRHAAQGLPSDDRTVAQPKIREFRQVAAEGRLQLEISQGTDWSVNVSYPHAVEHFVRWERQGNRLVLEFDPPYLPDGPRFPVIAKIVMPELEELVLKGHHQVELFGFEGDKLVMGIAGNNSLTGSTGHYESLDLAVAGRSRVDLSGIRVRDADVLIAGNSRVTLSMNGGVLSGLLAGVGTLSYAGSVSDESVHVAGAARFRHLY